MWSGSLLTNFSGSITGAHQRIDRLAYRYVKSQDSSNVFPGIREILHFEGKNGPDGIKAKSPGQDEPWHYFNPYDLKDSDVINFIQNHFNNLVTALKDKKIQRSAFESAWLAHAIVDGLTPAHHYPYEQELEILRGEPMQTRSSIKKKIIIPGSTKVEMIHNNWKMWGAKGLFTTHGTFELGVAMLLIGLSREKMDLHISDTDINKFGISAYYRKNAMKVADQNYYERYYKRGWTIKLSKDVRGLLLPVIVKVVSEVWLSALRESNKEPSK